MKRNLEVAAPVTGERYRLAGRESLPTDTDPSYRAHVGQEVVVVRELDDTDPEVGRMYEVVADDGWTGHVWAGELESLVVFDTEHPWSAHPAAEPHTCDLRTQDGTCAVWMLTDERREKWGVDDDPAYRAVAVCVEWYDDGRQVCGSILNQNELDDLRADFGLVANND